MTLRRFDYFAPTTVDEATQLLGERGDGSRPLAGGTDLIIQMKERGRRVPSLISLGRIAELRALDVGADGHLRIGAMTTAGEIEHHPAVRDRWPGVIDGAGLIGSIQIR